MNSIKIPFICLMDVLDEDTNNKTDHYHMIIYATISCWFRETTLQNCLPTTLKMTPKSLLSPVGVLRAFQPPSLRSGASAPSQDKPLCTQDRLTTENNDGSGQSEKTTTMVKGENNDGSGKKCAPALIPLVDTCSI